MLLNRSNANAQTGQSGSPQHSTPFGKSSTAEEVTAGLDLSGKTALITGCNAGIGFETLRVLTLRGACVYAVARTLEKAKSACAAVEGERGKAIPFACEQSDFSSVVECANAVSKHHAPIDMLICNAGVYFLPQRELAEGLEKHFVINHLSHFILVNRLLSLTNAARQGRVVVVGSDAYRMAAETGIEFDNLTGERNYDPERMYGQSKLANGLFVRELARRLAGGSTTANLAHSGWVMTETMRSFLKSRKEDTENTEAKSPEQGAATVCYVATNPSLRNISGSYFEDCHLDLPGGHMRDDAMAAKLWAVSEHLTRPYLL